MSLWSAILTLRRTLPWTALAVALTACDARLQAAELSLLPECVGRMELRLPEAEVALNTAATLEASINARLGLTEREMFARFSDGQLADYSSFGYSGRLLIAAPIDQLQYARLLRDFRKQGSDLSSRVKQGQSDRSGKPLTYSPLDDGGSAQFGWRFNGGYVLLSRVGSTVLKWSASKGGSEDLQHTKAYEFLRRAEQRLPNDVPKRPGVCLPQLFIADDERLPRFVATTYRLRAHPDITIWFQDRDGGPIPPGANPDRFTSIYDNEFWWSQNYRPHKYLKPIWRDLREIKLAGIPGHASMMELTRLDDTVDYGYFASARGDASTEAQPADLRLFIVRNAKDATSKGIEPMAKEEFIKLAQAVSASIRKRATVPAQ